MGPPVYSISGLEAVWDEYHDGSLRLKKKQNMIGIIISVPMIFTMSQGALATIAKMYEWPDWVFSLTAALTVVGLALFIAGIVVRLKFGGGVQKGEELKTKFEGNYVCPNPDCRRFVGYYPYNVLKQNTACPHCKCKWTQ